MFINLPPHPRRRLKTRTSTSMSSGLVVQGLLFRGPVATASVLLLSPEVRQWSGCLLDSTHPLDVGWYHDPSVLLNRSSLSSLSKNLGLSGSKWDLLWGSFQCLFIVRMCFYFRWHLWISCCPMCGWGHLHSYTTHSWCGQAHETTQERSGPDVVLCLQLLCWLCWQFHLIRALSLQAASSSCSSGCMLLP